MARSLVERRLVDLADRLKRLRDDLRVADEQLMQLRDEADDARLRSLVSETPVAAKEHRQAAKQLAKLDGHRQDVAADIAKHEAKSDELLDQMMERRNG
jgi:chromosome segregation ATPase